MLKLTQVAAAASISLLLVVGSPWAVRAQPAPAKAGAGVAARASAAAVAEPVQITLTRSKIVLIDGKESRQDAAVAKPGETLEEVATYTNKSSLGVKGLEATLPVPVNTELIVASISPGNAKASTDGQNFSALPLKRKVKQPNGVEVERPVPLAEYRYLRWYPGELAAQKSLVFSARFKVANDAPPATPAGQK